MSLLYKQQLGGRCCGFSRPTWRRRSRQSRRRHLSQLLLHLSRSLWKLPSRQRRLSPWELQHVVRVSGIPMTSCIEE